MTRRDFFSFAAKHVAKPIGAGLAAAVAVLQYRADATDKGLTEVKENLRDDLRQLRDRVDYHNIDIAVLKERTHTKEG